MRTENIKYKDSGIPWIGMIPEDWKYLKFKYSGKFEKGKLPFSTNNDGVGNPIIGASEMNGKSPTLYTEQQDIPMCNTDDVLILWDGANAGLIANNQQGIVSSTAVKYACKDNRCNKEYIYYQYKTFERYFKSKVSGTTIPHMNMKFINDCPLLLPPLPTQQRIADFLDRKCAEIDELAALQETMIAELKRYKQSVITEAVTKGLDKNVKMKDSGVEWIGEIPEGWKVKKVKNITTEISKGNGITKEEVFADGDTPCVRYGEIYSKYDNSFVNCFSKTKKDVLSTLHYFGKGDILCAGTGELVEEIGKSIVYLGENQCLAGGDIIVLRHCQNPLFLNFALNSKYAQAQKSCSKAKLKVVHISAFDIGNILIAFPPLSEQQAIADYLDQKCGEIDELIAIKQQKIEALKEYKKSVIFEYVTGKKEVRE